MILLCTKQQQEQQWHDIILGSCINFSLRTSFICRLQSILEGIVFMGCGPFFVVFSPSVNFVGIASDKKRSSLPDRLH